MIWAYLYDRLDELEEEGIQRFEQDGCYGLLDLIWTLREPLPFFQTHRTHIWEMAFGADGMYGIVEELRRFNPDWFLSGRQKQHTALEDLPTVDLSIHNPVKIFEEGRFELALLLLWSCEDPETILSLVRRYTKLVEPRDPGYQRTKWQQALLDLRLLASVDPKREKA